jgi:hypothetical protein
MHRELVRELVKVIKVIDRKVIQKMIEIRNAFDLATQLLPLNSVEFNDKVRELTKCVFEYGDGFIEDSVSEITEDVMLYTIYAIDTLRCGDMEFTIVAKVINIDKGDFNQMIVSYNVISIIPKLR